MTNRNDVLVIISIPFWRNTRYLISSEIYLELKEKYDVLLLGPMCGLTTFQNEFRGNSVDYYDFTETENDLNKPLKTFFLVSEALRKYGYYFRYRNGKMKYYWDLIINHELKKGNKSLLQSMTSRYLRFIFGILGFFENIWKVIDFLLGFKFFNTQKLHDISLNYRQVVVIQTANWSYQERLLGYFAKKYSHKKILLPYTTDQVTINGYMISDYDAVCPQGPIEQHYLRDYHKVPDKKLNKLGMLWLRNYELLLKKQEKKSQSAKKEFKTILYAGLTPDAFPRQSEFLAVDKILEIINQGVIPKTRLVYRPVGLNEEEMHKLEVKYKSNDLIEIQLPQTTMIGMTEQNLKTVSSDLKNYVNQITNVDLMIMSGTTTMAFEMLSMGVPCIANFTDPSGVLEKKGFTSTYIETDEFLISAKGILISYTLDEMISYLCLSLEEPNNAKSVARNVLSKWDYRNPRYVEDFIGIIDGFSDLEI